MLNLLSFLLLLTLFSSKQKRIKGHFKHFGYYYCVFSVMVFVSLGKTVYAYFLLGLNCLSVMVASLTVDKSWLPHRIKKEVFGVGVVKEAQIAWFRRRHKLYSVYRQINSLILSRAKSQIEQNVELNKIPGFCPIWHFVCSGFVFWDFVQDSSQRRNKLQFK